jgi:hypothetical protein
MIDQANLLYRFHFTKNKRFITQSLPFVPCVVHAFYINLNSLAKAILLGPAISEGIDFPWMLIYLRPRK